MEAPQWDSAWQRVMDFAHDVSDGVSVEAAGRACAADLEADAMGVTAINSGQIRKVVHTSGERGSRLEDAQLVAGEGPCTEAYQRQTPVEVSDLRQAPTRWPLFTSVAADANICAVYVLPLRVGRFRIGAANLYWTAPKTPNSGERIRAQAYARILSLLVLDEHTALATSMPTNPEPQYDAQGYPPPVHQAAGVIAAQHGMNVDEALARLRAHAYAHGWPLMDMAQRVLTGQSIIEHDDENPDSSP